MVVEGVSSVGAPKVLYLGVSGLLPAQAALTDDKAIGSSVCFPVSQTAVADVRLPVSSRCSPDTGKCRESATASTRASTDGAISSATNVSPAPSAATVDQTPPKRKAKSLNSREVREAFIAALHSLAELLDRSWEDVAAAQADEETEQLRDAVADLRERLIRQGRRAANIQTELNRLRRDGEAEQELPQSSRAASQERLRTAPPHRSVSRERSGDRTAHPRGQSKKSTSPAKRNAASSHPRQVAPAFAATLLPPQRAPMMPSPSESAKREQSPLDNGRTTAATQLLETLDSAQAAIEGLSGRLVGAASRDATERIARALALTRGALAEGCPEDHSGNAMKLGSEVIKAALR